MSEFYELVTAGPSPVSLADVKTYLKNPPSADDDVIQVMIDACTEWGEKWTGREFRANQWNLFLDCFTTRIQINRDPVDTINSISHLVSSSPVTIDSSIYYLKKATQFSEILLFEDESWPTDTDEREQAITIDFTTEQYRCGNTIENGIKRHVAFWYANRGDCSDCDSAATGAGMKSLYNFRIARV